MVHRLIIKVVKRSVSVRMACKGEGHRVQMRTFMIGLHREAKQGRCFASPRKRLRRWWLEYRVTDIV